MNLSDYDYHLPPELIAQEPLEDRDASRLLVLPKAGGDCYETPFRDIGSLFKSGDVLVLNDTRVTAVRIFGNRQTGGTVEALVMKPNPDGSYHAMVKPAKKLTVGTDIQFGEVRATVVREHPEGLRDLSFSVGSPGKWLQAFGTTPLPPYITAALARPERYQTVYADQGGSAAAPTAGLHFTPELILEIEAQGVKVVHVTLDVSLDTFRPIMVDDLSEHVMHGELCRISTEAAEAINHRTGRLIAVGTTSVRTLESFADSKGRVHSGEKDTRIFISPGVQFKCVEGLITNFHLPRTTMLLMLAAMVGRERLLDTYQWAIDRRFRFLSFGDSMAIL